MKRNIVLGLSAVMTAAMFLGSMPVLAAETVEVTPSRQFHIMKMSIFDAMVEEGVISQEKADALMAYMQNKEPGFMRGDNAYASCVEEGIITQEEADAIREFMMEKKPMGGFAKTSVMVSVMPDLEELVAEGLLTQEKADEVKAHLEQNMPFRKAVTGEDNVDISIVTDGDKMFGRAFDFSHGADITDIEIADMKSVDIEISEMKQGAVFEMGKSPFQSCVEAGILTQEEVSKIEEYIEAKREEMRKENVTNRVDRYVEEGILTNEEGDKLAEYLFAEDHAAISDKLIAEFEVEALDEDSLNGAKPKKISVGRMLGVGENLVDDGIVTAEQLEKMQALDKAFFEAEFYAIKESGEIAGYKVHAEA